MASKPTRERLQKEIEDKALKTRNAREAAEAPGASDRDKADLKLMEQDLQAARQKSKRSTGTADKATDASTGSKPMERKLDAALEDSFPGSDPVSFVQAGPSEKEEPGQASETAKNRRDTG